MKNNNNKKQKGFIAIFFVLGISFTFLTWISLSSERVFEYVHLKEEFIKNRTIVHNHMLCSDAFVNTIIGSRFNLSFVNNSHEFNRSLYFVDNYKCKIDNISIVNESDEIKHIFFISGDYSFEYILKNGFVNFRKSFNLL